MRQRARGIGDDGVREIVEVKVEVEEEVEEEEAAAAAARCARFVGL